MATPQERADTRDLYRIFRTYMEHEDELINQRQTWNLTIQGFLFASYAFSLQKLVEAESRAVIDAKCYAAGVLGQCTAGDIQRTLATIHRQAGVQDLAWLISVIPFVGVGVSLFVWLGVEAARMALTSVKHRWRIFHESKIATESGVNELPEIAGGGRKAAVVFGFYAPRIVSWVFIVGWSFLLAVRVSRNAAFAILIAVPAVWAVYMASSYRGLFKRAHKIPTPGTSSDQGAPGIQ